MAKAAALPGIEVWVERVDDSAFAVFACRRWEASPRLTVWRLFRRGDEGFDGMWGGWRGAGAAILLEAEAKLHPRWYRYCQRQLVKSVNDYGLPIDGVWAVTQFYEAINRPAGVPAP